MQDERAQFLAELDALQRRAAALEQRLARSRRSTLLTPALFLVAGFVLGGICLSWQDAQSLAQEATGPLAKAAQPGQQMRDLVCNSLKIVGPDGKARVTIGFDKISGFVTVCGSDGKARSELSTNNGQFGALGLFDENTKMRVFVYGHAQGGGAAKFMNKDGTEHVYIGTDKDKDSGLVILKGSNNQRLVELAHDADGGVVRVNGHDGKARANLWVVQGGKNGMLTLHNEQGEKRVWLGVDEHGGVLNLDGANGKTQVYLDCDNKWGGGLDLYGPQNTKLIYLGGNSHNGHGLFQLYSSGGQKRVSMLVDDGGVGGVYGYNAAGQTIRSLK